MPLLDKYRHYFDIDPDYFPAVNEAVITANPDMWKKFFPHETFAKLIRNTVSVLDRKQKLSIWVEGAYGTGKSHAVLTLKRLLDASDADTREYFEKYHLDADLCNNLQRIKNSGKVLTVHRYGSSSIHGDQDLVLAIQESIDQAFAQAGMENKGSDSLKDSVIRYLEDEENKQSFGIYVKGSYSDLFGGDSVDDIIAKLKSYDGPALHTLMDKIFKLARERQIKAFSMSAKDLADWIKGIIKANNLKAIVFIWDEFTEYFYNNSRNLTGFQELTEISETDPFYFILVTHVSSGLFSDRDQDFIKLNGRFVNPHSLISLPENIAFQLMGAAMEKNSDSEVTADWEDITEELQDRTKEARKLVKAAARIQDKELKDIIPIHPYTALLLKHISSAFDSNQRSMFDFIKNDRGDEIKGFQWFIDNYGPEDDNPLLTVDMLWEFFYDKGRDFLAHDIRSVLDYFTLGANQKLSGEEKRVLKTILLLQAISQHAGDSVDLFIPNEKNVDNAFEGSDLDAGAAVRCAEKLVRDKVLFKKQLGGGKFQYNAYVSSVDPDQLDKYKKQIDAKSTTSFVQEPLVDRTTITDVFALGGALKPRYELRFVSSSDFDSKIRELRNQEANFGNKILAVVSFAKDDQESTLIGKKIRAALNDGSYHMVFIDATTSPFGKNLYEQYREDMAQSMYQQGKDNGLMTQYANNAKDSLKKWKTKIAEGEFVVYTAKKPAGERATSMDALYTILADINKAKYPESLEAAYTVIPNMYLPNSVKQGVECGANQKTAGTFLSSNPATKLENALAGAWQVPEYWVSHPSLHISRLKAKVDAMVSEQFQTSNRISIKTIYDVLKEAPYGFMPCNLSAFILGFLLKEYANGTYSWSDGLTNDVLDVNKLKEMVAEVISLQITPNSRYKDKYIVAMTAEEKAFNEATSVAFDISRNLCTSVEQTRERIRNKMKEFSFPIWTLKYTLDGTRLKTRIPVLENLIDNFCGIANSHNIAGAKTDSDIAMEIGRTCIANPNAAEDLRTVLTKENCLEGMKVYLAGFEGGTLPALAAEIGDGGQYLNVLRKKFDADAANWVWNINTAQQKIRETILDYQIISESNKYVDKTVSIDKTVVEWCEKCQYIRISYAAARNYLDDLGPFMELLHTMKKSGQLLDSQKPKFLELVRNYGSAFVSFRNNQEGLFKQVCSFYLDGFSDAEISDLFKTIPAGVFTYDKSEYIKLVDKKTQEFRASIGVNRLRTLWREKTGSASPREWSNKHKMPILSLISDAELSTARAAFDTVNKAHPDAVAVDKAIRYLEGASFYDKLKDNSYLDRVFTSSIIKGYSVMLTDVDVVKDYLDSKISADAYDWFGLPEVEKKLRQMAEDRYSKFGCDKALEKIDEMDVADVKRYLKELIKDNMIVGMEIIKG